MSRDELAVMDGNIALLELKNYNVLLGGAKWTI